jgi:hypothetical protein
VEAKCVSVLRVAKDDDTRGTPADRGTANNAGATVGGNADRIRVGREAKADFAAGTDPV